MSQYFEIHPTHPQKRLLVRAAEIVRAGGLVVYPTDTSYALGCQIGNRRAVDRVEQLRRLDRHHMLTLACRDLSELATYAQVDKTQYRILKHYTPGPFTFVLTASRETPRRLVHEKRRTIGIRVPDNAIVRGLLEELGEPILTTTMRLPEQELPLTDPEALREALERRVDLIIAGGHCSVGVTTLVDLTGDVPEVLRQGMGDFQS
ncbi:MAG: threonylcarbamoyl-AMP synthase [Pseudomonadales bacterium]|nr:threonylcarbamoyl-AMP synthase [Pseudomonadales bacterium]MCP5182433.1 threonylcarbamoyl-AMP synthase [Pseudomonadales bacterium]